MSTLHYWTGVGSRDTPSNVQTIMTSIAQGLAKGPYILRSGGAVGADSAFEKGIVSSTQKEIYLPFKGFNNNPSILYADPTPQAVAWARKAHPYFDKMHPSGFAYKAHARNAHQVLGQHCDTPSDFVVCWTPDGAENAKDSWSVNVTGGTRTAIVIAELRGVPVFNLERPDALLRLTTFVKENKLLDRIDWEADPIKMAEIDTAKNQKRRASKVSISTFSTGYSI